VNLLLYELRLFAAGIYNEIRRAFSCKVARLNDLYCVIKKKYNSYLIKKYINKTVLKFDFFRKFERTHPHVASQSKFLKSDFKPIDILTAINYAR